ncbi:MAG: hypothetical protein JW759_04090 [Candidatus Coatesbacteria bacterium]|nr:hypothetical protein [Candidatus Coatesbacteria bacterium]
MGLAKCPRCGLISPEGAQRCDCGFDFGSCQVVTREGLKHPFKGKVSEKMIIGSAAFCGLCIASIVSPSFIAALVGGGLGAGAGCVVLGLIYCLKERGRAESPNERAKDNDHSG